MRTKLRGEIAFHQMEIQTTPTGQTPEEMTAARIEIAAIQDRIDRKQKEFDKITDEMRAILT